MPTETSKKTPSALQDYIAEQVDIVKSIPEGMWLASYPTHDDTPSCWCHPRLVWSIGGPELAHKNLHNAEFDA
jgi:hypothetical protein